MEKICGFFGNGFARNIVIVCVDNSSSPHNDNQKKKKKKIVLCEQPTEGINDALELKALMVF